VLEADDLDYIINWNDGTDTIHRNPGFEECNLDDAVERAHVDAKTARAMVSSGHAKVCQHCKPLADEVHL